jgi:NAD(P)-dependent dehydrogenase (short-subunit alcohol dehydrogenase family)
MADLAEFRGRTALVTGGASGIGRALGAALAAAGARVVLADMDGDGAAAAAAAAGGDARGRTVDVTDLDAVRAAVADAAGDDGLDYLFNNAGIALGGPTHELTAAHWDRIIDVNLRGVINGVLAAYPAMVAAGRGHIVNTASAAGLAPPPLVAPYATTKAAVVGLSLALRPEAALHGVRVSVLCPGMVETPILDAGPPAGLPATASAPVTAREYLRRMRQTAISADRCAAAALAAVARDQGIIVVPRRTRALWWLQRLSPAATTRVSRSMARAVTRDLVRPA